MLLVFTLAIPFTPLPSSSPYTTLFRSELRDQLVRHRRKLPCRVPIPAPLPGLPLDPEHARDPISEDRVVQLGQRDDRGVHRATGAGAPFLVLHRQHFVAAHDVRVQLRTTTA